MENQKINFLLDTEFCKANVPSSLYLSFLKFCEAWGVFENNALTWYEYAPLELHQRVSRTTSEMWDAYKKENPKQSKVALCSNCGGFVMAADVTPRPALTKKDKNRMEKEFTELTNEGFEVKLEYKEETQARKFSLYSECSAKKCTKKE